jgi:hypothetical protein
MRTISILIAMFISANCYCQKEGDAALVKEFTKVMSFSSQQYISYAMLTKVAAAPVMQPEDTITTNGMFYKNGNSMYSGNELEETYFQDSFFIQVNHARKTIWVNKASPKEFEKLAEMPLSNTTLEKLTGENFTASKTVNGQGSKIVFQNTKEESSTTITTNISLAYSNTTSMPSVLDMQIMMQQPWSEEMAAELKAGGIDDTGLIQDKDGKKFWLRNQSVQVSFENINTTKEAVMKMPLWTDKFAYSAAEKKFTTKGGYSDYEITQLF